MPSAQTGVAEYQPLLKNRIAKRRFRLAYIPDSKRRYTPNLGKITVAVRISRPNGDG